MNIQKMLIGVATTAVGFAFGLWAYNKLLVSKPAMTKAAQPAATSSDAEGK